MLFLRHDRAEQAYVAMFTACAAYGKFPSMDGICDHTLMEKFIRLSIRFLLGGDDVSLMMGAAKARTAFLQSIPRGENPSGAGVSIAAPPINPAVSPVCT